MRLVLESADGAKALARAPTRRGGAAGSRAQGVYTTGCGALARGQKRTRLLGLHPHRSLIPNPSLSLHTCTHTHVPLFLRRAPTPHPQHTRSACGSGCGRVLGTLGISTKRHNPPGTPALTSALPSWERDRAGIWLPAMAELGFPVWLSVASASRRSVLGQQTPKCSSGWTTARMRAESRAGTGLPGNAGVHASHGPTRTSPAHACSAHPRTHTHTHKGAELPPRPLPAGNWVEDRGPPFPLPVPKAMTSLPAPAISAWADGSPWAAAQQPSAHL